jgi:dTDP-4-dehydrorhamnose 3,5-epimerase
MERVHTQLEGPILLAPTVHADERGFFVETFRTELLAEFGIDENWVQDNHSRSRRGTLRGMHFQRTPGQAKLVRCARGSIFDVIVDLRRDSPTFGQWESFELDDEMLRMIYIPIGFAHGFCVTSEVADVVYKCSSYFLAETEGTLAYDDPEVGIEWPQLERVVSARDTDAPRLSEIAADLPF